ncbi:SDR family NAD(P)-dependent oxidoreductase [Ruminococcus sp. NK3A76]|uniref:SDR family NAD(P)-dependent oxidoreductase n=1 Tax=Ruminococcus sp. NK3A76 TaxID=877411 RepID=UPI00048B367C|nr:SDR family NAD(P)-dependent oxidoreductase [Ruminococcus sp. NK3A76]
MKTIAIITGAAGGLGSEFTKQLYNEVDEIWAIGRNVAKLDALKKTLGDKVRGFSVDLSDPDNLSVISDELEKGEYEVRWLINNAGSGRMARSDKLSASEISSHINTHNTSVAMLCNICIPFMKKGCHILNISSQSSFQPVPYINLYAASKAFTLSYSRALNVELKDTGITVTACCPGWIKTDLLKEEINGVKIKFPHMAQPADVARKAIADARKGRDMSVYGAYVKTMQFFSKYYPHRLIMKFWMMGIGKYIK